MMRNAVLVVLFAICVAEGADTPAAEYTRAKRLPAKLTLAVKDKSLKAVLDEISTQLEANKQGRLRFEIAPAAASMVPPMVSVEVKDAPLADVLAKLLRPAGLDYAIISLDGDAKDGWIRIVKGDGKAVVEEKPAGPPATAEEEADAKLKLATAKQAMTEGKPADAKILLGYILRKYATSEAAKEAKTLLESLKP